MGKTKMNKTCNKCGESKPSTPEYFGRIYAGKDNRLKNTCKSCCVSYGRAWYKDRRGHQLTRLYRHFDEQRGLSFDLDEEWFNEHVANSPCHYCGFIEPKMGVDRLNNSLGHTRENCVPCCQTCNRVRLDTFTPEEMKELGAVIRRIKQARFDSGDEPLAAADVGSFGHRRK